MAFKASPPCCSGLVATNVLDARPRHIFLWFRHLRLCPGYAHKGSILSDDEKVMLLEHTKVNQVGLVNRDFKVKEFLEVSMDPQFILVFIAVACQGTGGGAITTYSTTLLTALALLHATRHSSTCPLEPSTCLACSLPALAPAVLATDGPLCRPS